jgi:hypothetical protein
MYLILSSCSTVHKWFTHTETITIVKVDTIIKFVPDTLIKIDSVYYTDTAKVDTPVATARAYYNVRTQHITLSLKGKIIDVPVKINQVAIKREDVREVNKKPATAIYIIIAILISTIFSLFLALLFKWFKL